MDDEGRTIRILIDPELSEAHRELIRRGLERTRRFEVVEPTDPRGHHVKFCAREDILDIAALHNESRSLTERTLGELQGAAYATEQYCPGDEIGRMRGDGRRELLTNAAGTYQWPEPRRKRGRK